MTDTSRHMPSSETEHLLRYIVKHDPNAIAVYDNGLHYLAVSDRYLADYDVREEDVIGKHHYEVFPEMPQRWKEVHRRCLAGAVERSEDDRFERPDGSITYNRWECRPWYAADGSIGGIITYTEVTTERKLAEKALRDALLQLKTAVEAGHVGLWDWDLATGKVSYSDQWKAQVGCAPEEIGEGFDEWESRVHPEDLQPTMQKIRQFIDSTVESYRVEFRFRHKDGSYRWILALASIMRDEAGRPLRTLGSHVDITERKLAEEALRRSENTLNRIFDILPIGLWFADAEGKLLRGNPAGVSIWGAEPHVGPEQYGVFKARRLPGGQELAPEDWSLARTVRDAVTVSDELLEIDAFDGKTKVIRNYTAPLLDADGQVEGAVVVNLDITEEQKLQEQYRQAQKMESIGKLAGGIAHDFNNMLAGIMGFADLLRARVTDPELKGYAENVVTGARRASDLTRQLLAFSRKGHYRDEPVDLHQVIHEVVDILKHSIDKRIAIRQHLDADPSVTRGDITQLQNALLNLAVNARDAMPEGGQLTFETSLLELTEAYCRQSAWEIAPGPYVRVCVTDTGCGISPEHRKRLFEPFFTTKETGRGTGMGLAAVYGTVTQHSGAIHVYSEVGHGTAFKLYLPLETEAAQRTGPMPTERPARVEGHVLAVDDEPLLRTMVTDMLEDLGCTVEVAENGQAAIDYFSGHHHEVDLVVLDMMMPAMNGAETYRKLKAIDPNVKVLLASGYSINGDAQQLMEQGVKGFLQKPFDSAELAVKVAEALRD